MRWSFLPSRSGATMALVVLVSALLVIPTAASGDVGDGREACNTGEICLYDWPAWSGYTKYFWWSAAYAPNNYQWWDTVDDEHQGEVDDDMSAAVNKDTRCKVRFVDWATGNAWTIANDNFWHTAPAWINDAPDEHVRVSRR